LVLGHTELPKGPIAESVRGECALDHGVPFGVVTITSRGASD
jgi:hypothetical protein